MRLAVTSTRSRRAAPWRASRTPAALRRGAAEGEEADQRVPGQLVLADRPAAVGGSDERLVDEVSIAPGPDRCAEKVRLLCGSPAIVMGSRYVDAVIVMIA
jgi:hypothetical protein